MQLCDASVSDLKKELMKRDNERLASIPKGSVVHPKMYVMDVYHNLIKHNHWNEAHAVDLNGLKFWADIRQTNKGTSVEFSGLHIKCKNEEFIKHPLESRCCDLLLEDIIKYNEMV
jgi:hypothetical protein